MREIERKGVFKFREIMIKYYLIGIRNNVLSDWLNY